MNDVAIVMGTFNRLPLLQKSVASIRRAAGSLVYEIVVVDGGSTDGSREWLAQQADVVLIGQRLPLTGAVKAFNLGFGYAVDSGVPFVCHFNDDAEFVTDGAIEQAVAIMRARPEIGEVAFEFDLFPGRQFDAIHDRWYANFGVVRREAGMSVARAQGDPGGRAWWCPAYKVYGADTEFGCWLWKLGWEIERGFGLKVHDANPQDALRANHEVINPDRTDSKLFWSRGWKDPASLAPLTKLEGVKWEGAKLHLGCGTHRMKHWLNVDGLPGPAVDVVMDFVQDVRRIPSSSLERIYWSHGPEHVHPDQLNELLRQLRRTLKPGGKIQLATIDFPKIFENRFKSTKNGGAWNSALYGETTSKDHPFLSHKQAFTEGTLLQELVTAGFTDVRPWKLDDYPEIKTIRDYALTCELVTCFAEGRA